MSVLLLLLKQRKRNPRKKRKKHLRKKKRQIQLRMTPWMIFWQLSPHPRIPLTCFQREPSTWKITKDSTLTMMRQSLSLTSGRSLTRKTIPSGLVNTNILKNYRRYS
uniref:Uncharacterized protein n=1 Tax=Cacopsylla melanoneura TaxID=428564 RepID=A0A8D8WT04_9HEMI